MCEKDLFNDTMRQPVVHAAAAAADENHWRKGTCIAFWAAIATPILVLAVQLVAEFVVQIDHPIVLLFYWIPLCCLPIPLAVILWGIHLKAKGQAWNLTVRVGVVSTVCLCIFFSVGMPRYQEVRGHFHDREDAIRGEAFIQNAETLLDIDVPNWDAVHIWDDDGIQRAGRNQNYVRYRFWLGHDDAAVFEMQLVEDERWEQNVRNELLGIQPGLWEHDWKDGQFALFYNMDLKEFNQVPTADGTYRYIYVAYDPDVNCLLFVEYDLIYLK